MKTSYVVAGVLFLILARPRSKQPPPLVTSTHGYLVDSTTWGEDQWARLYAADLPPPDAQSGHTAYGLHACNCTGFNA